MKRIGVILARFQPVHNGHLALIKKALNENERVLLLVGSADKLNERNPIPLQIRVDMLVEALKDLNLMENIIVRPLDDLSTENDNSIEWGFYLYSSIVDVIEQSSFNLYYSDGYEIITTWFPGFLLRNYVSLTLLARRTVEEGISATMVRSLICDPEPKGDFKIKGKERLLKVVPESVERRKDMLKHFIILNKNR